jgi:cytochrome c oxidase cbb3-type subunit I/II
VTVAVLHLVNSLAIPVLALKSYSVFGGAQDALVQWWYGHNAVAFFLTTPVLGIMYYYVPKAANRPVYSYRLSIVHFWALIFVYIWAGPHHLLNTALPDWAQTLGMVFSLMLWAPSWGGMLNGFLTIRGAWDKLRSDPVLKFFAVALTFYGMATFEGPLLSIKAVSGLAHYTDWIVGHVHAGALGWNGFMAAGMFYFLVPRLYGRDLYSKKLADIHFWVGTFGIVLYVGSMWISGVTQGLMWRATAPGGGLLYPNFVETLIAIRPMYWVRLIGGLLYLAGMVLMTVNLVQTARLGAPVTTQVVVAIAKKEADLSWVQVLTARPMAFLIALFVAVVGFGLSGMLAAPVWLVLIAGIGIAAALVAIPGDPSKPHWHRILEGRALLFTGLTIVAVLVGGVVELVPVLIVKPSEAAQGHMAPYTALEIEGRDVYLREGCYNCHSQMIRPFGFETARYGKVSELSDSTYDHPFQWGSKRTGPDLAREGGKYPHLWHYQHLLDPRAISPDSNMPLYAHLASRTVDYAITPNKLRALRSVGVPYSAQEVAAASRDAREQAHRIRDDLQKDGVHVGDDTEMVALVSYLQRLGLERSTHIPAPASPERARDLAKNP